MQLGPYREVLALPGFRVLMLVALVARIPVVAAPVTLTLYVLDLGRGYAAAGTVGAAITVASAIGAPLLGRLVDRRSLRTALGITLAVEAGFWAVAPSLGYVPLLVAAIILGLFTIPVFSIVRQSVAALVPEEQRRPAYALDSMAVELSFMVGPAAAVFLVTHTSPATAMYTVGAAIVVAGAILYALNPPVRGAAEAASPQRVERRSWLRPRFVAVLIISAATTAVLAATDLALIAELRAVDKLSWVGVVLAAWGAYSMIGGFVYGAVHRSLPTAALLALLGACTIPVGLVDGVGWLILVLIPAGALCAPTLASAADAVSRLVPAGARGEAMGLHNSALTLGLGTGAPLTGAVIDNHGPAWGFVVVGAVSLAIGLCLLPFAGPITGGPPGDETPDGPEATSPVGTAVFADAGETKPDRPAAVGVPSSARE